MPDGAVLPTPAAMNSSRRGTGDGDPTADDFPRIAQNPSGIASRPKEEPDGEGDRGEITDRCVRPRPGGAIIVTVGSILSGRSFRE